MATPLLIVIALVGASALGFLTAWHFQHVRNIALKEQYSRIKNELESLQKSFNDLTTVNEAQLLSIENYKKLMVSLEIQNQELEKSLLLSHQTTAENVQAEEKLPIEQIREIEVIREVPVLVFRDHGPKAKTKEEKAAKLLKAFKKGIEIEGNKSNR